MSANPAQVTPQDTAVSVHGLRQAKRSECCTRTVVCVAVFGCIGLSSAWAATTPTITWPTPAAINHGTALSATQLNATANVPGTFSYTPATGTVPAAGTDALSVIFTPTDTTDYTTAVDTVSLVVNGPAPIITTVAGNGTKTYSGDGGPAVNAGLFGETDIKFDKAGNYYIADRYNNAIRKVNITTGVITTVAGGKFGYSGDGGPATSAALEGPFGLAFDGAGDLYFSDSNNNVIRKVTVSTGIITTVAGNGTAGYTGDGGAATSAELSQPQGLAFDAAGNLYIADEYNSVVRKVTISTGVITTVAGTGVSGPSSGDGGPATAAVFWYCSWIAFDAAGNLYISDQLNDRVRKVSASTGIITTVVEGPYGFIGDGGPATNAWGRWPLGLAFDASGNLYVADSVSDRIRKINTSTGIITTVAGNGVEGSYGGDGGPATSAELGNPAGITFDSHGNLYIADNGNNRVREVSFKAAVEWPTPAPITSGTALSSTQLNATANVPGTFVYSPAAGTVLPTGVHTLSVTFTPTDTTDYSSVTATVSLVVGNVADSGTITLTVNGTVSATTTYGSGSTPESVAAGLAAGVTSGSPVNLSYVGDALNMVSKTTGSSTDYAYTLATTTYDSRDFTQPSFLNPSVTGNLDGGANQNTSGATVYQYSIPSSGGYEKNSNLLAYSDSVMGTWVFNYDNLNRLAGAQDSQPGNSFTNYCWSYDAFGNRTIQSPSTSAFQSGSGGSSPCVPANPQPLTFNTKNQISNGPIVPAYDPAGEVTNDGTNQYLYNADGNICAVQAPQFDGLSVMTGYIYDADGNRVAKGTITSMSCDPSVNGFVATANYVLDQAGNQMTELDTDSNGKMAFQHTNVYANGTLMATYDSSEVHFRLNDWLGTLRAQTDYAGVSEQTCNSWPFGDQLNCSGSTQFPTEQHFTGKERDQESGNDYFGARYYGSSMGRLLSPDPSGLSLAYPGDPQSFNLYSYVGNHPLEYVDPYGLNWFNQAPCGGAYYAATSLGSAIRSFVANLFANCGGSSHSGQDDPPIRPDSAFQTGSGRQFNTSAEIAIGTLQHSANDLQKKRIRKKACIADLGTLGLTAEMWKGGARLADFVNGVGSQVPFSATAPESNPNLRPGTIGAQFATHPGTTALAVLNGHTIYINPSLIDPTDYYGNLGLVGHEVVHNVTGDVDEVIQQDLGITVDPNNTLNITQKLIRDCF